MFIYNTLFWIFTDVTEVLILQLIVIVEGLLSIQAGENPRVIEEKLKSFLTPQAAGSLGEGDEAGGEA